MTYHESLGRMKDALRGLEAAIAWLENGPRARGGFGVPGMVSEHWLTVMKERYEGLSIRMRREADVALELMGFLMSGDMKTKDRFCDMIRVIEEEKNEGTTEGHSDSGS